MIQLIYELAKAEIKAANYDPILESLEYFSSQLQTVLLTVDLGEVWTALNTSQHFWEEKTWQLTSGRWPEMETFLQNFLRKTVGQQLFWHRLTQQFLPEMLNEEVPVWAASWLEQELELDTLRSLLENIAEGNRYKIKKLFRDIRHHWQ